MVLRLALSLGLVPGLLLAVPAASAVETKVPTAAYAHVVIGRSVDGRPITAWHLGETHRPKVLLVGAMHGNETAPSAILRTLRDGRTVHGIDLWVLPTYNPDGAAAGTRRNAHGVDLNRNYPYHWAPLSGSYYSGPRPASEPETRAMMRFLTRIRPDWVLSFHQPLHGVDVDVERPAFARRVARLLGLPTTRLDCGGVCHGTMTGWFNHHLPGFALTVEYGASPSRALMTRTAPGQVLRIFHAWRGTNEFDPVP